MLCFLGFKFERLKTRLGRDALRPIQYSAQPISHSGIATGSSKSLSFLYVRVIVIFFISPINLLRFFFLGFLLALSSGNGVKVLLRCIALVVYT